jgi:phospholipid/cholesterol/gamma-HCH transport system substrate-binding protein
MPPPADPLPPTDIPHAPLKAAGLVLVTLFAIVAFILFVMHARGVFQPIQRLLLAAESSEGVAVGSSLTFSGFAIGRVVRIELGDDGKALLHIEVPIADARWLRTSSVFTLERGVVGGASLRAFSGLLDDPPLPDGARREVLIGDTSAGVQQLMANSGQLIINLERLTAEQSALVASLNNLQQFSAALNGRHGALNAILGGEKNGRQVIEALERANMLLAKADARLFARDGLMDKAQLSIDELARLLGEARIALKKADDILANASAASTDLDVLRNEIEATLRRVNVLSEELNTKWPFAREREIRLP